MEIKNNKICVKSAKLPNGFEEIDINLKEHFPADHVVQLIKPDGLCGISCGSSHMFAKPEEGVYLRIK